MLQNNPTRRWLRPLLIISIVVVAGGLFFAAWKSAKTPRGEAVAKITGLNGEQNLLARAHQSIGKLIALNYQEYRKNTIRWSAAYFSCLFFSAVFSAFAGLVLKLEFFVKNAELKKDLAALLAMLAALLITLSTVGDFQRKWQANRMAASGMENLAYDLLARGPDHDVVDLIHRIQQINLTRNQEIIGATETAAKKDGAKFEDR